MRGGRPRLPGGTGEAGARLLNAAHGRHSLRLRAAREARVPARLLYRLWREHVRYHKGRLLVVLLLTLVMAGTTAIYPVVIDRAFSMFTQRDPRICTRSQSSSWS